MLNQFLTAYPWAAFLFYAVAGLFSRVGCERFTAVGRLFYFVIFPVHASIPVVLAAVGRFAARSKAAIGWLFRYAVFFYVLWLFYQCMGGGPVVPLPPLPSVDVLPAQETYMAIIPTRRQFEAVGALLLCWLTFGAAIRFGKLFLDGLLSGALRLFRERERRRQQRLYDAQRIEQRRAEQEQSLRQEAYRRNHEFALHSDRQTARQHLTEFCRANEDALADTFPPLLLQAFLRSQMPDGLDTTKLWTVAEAKIAELLPVIQRKKDQTKREQDRRAKRELQFKRFDTEIAAVRAKIERLQKSGLDADTIDDETQFLFQRIRQIEEQKDLLMSLHDEL